MKIIESTIKDFKRFTVSNINEFYYKPKHKIQIILGTNGSGKSSLLRELIPIVDNDTKTNYKDKTGYKQVVYEHNDSIYTLTYSNNKFSFIKDKEELNITGQRKLQQQLIEQHFNINKLVYELLLGITGFSNMSISERKKWFTDILTHLDYSYALETYKATKDRIKELKSYIKLTRAKISKDEYLLQKYDKDKIEKVKEEIKELDNYFDYLVSLHKPYEDLDKPTNIENKINKLLELLNKLEPDEDKKYIELKIRELEDIKKELITKKDFIAEELKKLNNVKSNIIEPDEIKSELKNITKEIKEIKDKFKIDDIRSFISYIREFHNNYSSIIDIINKLRDIPIIDKDLYNKNIESIKQLNNLYNKIENEINHIEEHITKTDKLEEHSITCPKCGYTCNINSKADREELDNKLIKLTKEKESLLKTITELNNVISDYEKRKSLLMEFVSNFSNVKENTIFNLILNNTDKLKSNYDYIYNVNTELPDPYELNHLLNKELELQQQIKTLENFNYDNYKLMINKKQDLLKQNSGIIKSINEINSDIDKYKRKQYLIKEIETLHNDLLAISKYVVKYENNSMKITYNNMITELLNDIRKIKSELEVEYLEYAKVKDRYISLEEELKDHEQRLQAAIDLEKLLSPSKGIIGEYISKTINVILERMNEIINRIWTYDIEILPCDLEDSDLTFKFPVKVNNKEIIQDISKGSSSMKEVFDIAFKITAMEFLNMLDYPLILDEFGRTMDETHRIKAYNFIEEISKDYFSQVFIVSHFESMYARFVNTDVVVLDKSNLTFDIIDYNSVIKIK